MTPNALPEWGDLLDRLLTGTRDQPSDAFAGLSPERALLAQLALSSAMQRAGTVAQRERKLPQADAAPPDGRPPCSPTAMYWLHMIRRIHHTRPMIADWFIAIDRQGRRIPIPQVHSVVELALNVPTLQPHVTRVIGTRGHWLVMQVERYKPLRAPELWGPERPPLTPSPTLEEIHRQHPNVALDTLVQTYQRMMREITA
jgi:hypothetical protein